MTLGKQWQLSESTIKSWPKAKVLAAGALCILPFAAGYAGWAFNGVSFGAVLFLVGAFAAYVGLTFLAPERLSRTL